jgi:hypothetical protein
VVTAWVQENAGPLLEKSEMYFIGHGLIANIVGMEMVLRSEPLLKIEDQTQCESAGGYLPHSYRDLLKSKAMA